MSKQFWFVVVAIFAVLVGVYFITANHSPSSSSSSKATQHIEGSGQDGVTLVEYGDFQCPFCGQYYQPLKQLVSTYSSEIYFQFRNFPLTSLHPNAFAAARAAEAAGLMGQYWQMHDLLYEQNYKANILGQSGTWVTASNPQSAFDQDAQSLGLNVQQFNQYYASDQVNNLVLADENAGNALSIDATPTFYLDGKTISPGVFLSNGLIDSNATIANFEKDINNEIAKKGHTPPTNTSTGSATSSTSGGQSVQTKTTGQ